MKGSQLAVFLMLLCFRDIAQGRAMEISSIREAEERRTEAGTLGVETSQPMRPDFGLCALNGRRGFLGEKSKTK